MSWKGPFSNEEEGGITQSLLNRFQECPYRFYIYAILGLEDNRPLHKNLMWGDTAHVGLEHLLAIPKIAFNNEFTDSDWKIVDDSIDKRLKDYPDAGPTWSFSIKQMMRLYNDSFKQETGPLITEHKFHIPISLPGISERVWTRGKCDGINEGWSSKLGTNRLVEHKFKGRIEVETARDELPFDLQVNLYARSFGCNSVTYDIIRIPDTMLYLPDRRPMQKSPSYVQELYFERNWGDFPITKNKHKWIFQSTKHLEYIDIVWGQSIIPLIKKLIKWWNRVNEPGFDFLDYSKYDDVFYKVPIRHFDPSHTEWYHCSYHSLLTDQIELSDLIPVKSFFSELQEAV